MLAQLEKVEGVKSAMANHTGSLVRVSITEEADAGTVAQELSAILKKQGRKPKSVTGEKLASSIKSEEWRDSERIGELSEIEFRTVFAKRVKQFVEKGEFEEEIAAKLMKFSEEVLADTASATKDTDWKDFCSSVANRMLEKAKDVLTEEQLEEFAKQLRARVIG